MPPTTVKSSLADVSHLPEHPNQGGQRGRICSSSTVSSERIHADLGVNTNRLSREHLEMFWLGLTVSQASAEIMHCSQIMMQLCGKQSSMLQ